MIYTRAGVLHRVVVGLDGGVYVCTWISAVEDSKRHSTPHWVVMNPHVGWQLNGRS